MSILIWERFRTASNYYVNSYMGAFLKLNAQEKLMASA